MPLASRLAGVSRLIRERVAAAIELRWAYVGRQQSGLIT